MMRPDMTAAEWIFFFMLVACIVIGTMAYDDGVSKGREIERQHRLARQERRRHYNK